MFIPPVVFSVLAVCTPPHTPSRAEIHSYLLSAGILLEHLCLLLIPGGLDGGDLVKRRLCPVAVHHDAVQDLGAVVQSTRNEQQQQQTGGGAVRTARYLPKENNTRRLLWGALEALEKCVALKGRTN